MVLLLNVVILHSGAGQNTYWVAPRASDCGDRTPCRTLSNYADDKPSPFSESHARWIFLEGEHRMRPRSKQTVDISNALNITLTGMQPCGHGTEHCSTTVIMPMTISNVSNLTILNLNYSRVGYEHYKVYMQVVPNLTMHSITLNVETVISNQRENGFVTISNINAKEPLQLLSHRPDQFVREWSIIEPLPAHSPNRNARIAISDSVFLKTSRLSVALQTADKLHVQNCSFVNSQVKLVSDQKLLSRSPAYDYVQSCTTLRCHVQFTWPITVIFDSCTFVSSRTSLTLMFQAKTIHEMTVSKCSFISGHLHERIPWKNSLISVNSSEPTHIELERTHIIGFQGMYLVHLSLDNVHSSYSPWRAPFSIIINSCQFENSEMWGIVNNRYTVVWQRPPKLPIAISSKLQNPLDPFVSFRIAFNGTTIFRKFKYPVQLGRAIVWVKGNVRFEIEHDWLDCTHGLSALATLSKVFLYNNSHLTISSEHQNECNTLLFVEPLSRSNVAFENFVTCDIYKQGDCNEGCFFQFINDNNTYLTQQSLEYFNATITLSSKPARNQTANDSGTLYKIYNGNLERCSLFSRDGDLSRSLTDRLIKKHIKLDFWNKTTIGSPPYYACLCDASQPYNADFWDCEIDVVNITAYPHLPVQVSFVVLGDYHFPSRTLSSKTSESKTTCEEAFATITPNVPGSTIEKHVIIQMEKNNLNVAYYLSKPIIVRVINCPEGFKTSSNIEFAGTVGCVCNDLLRSHNFKCTIKSNGIKAEIAYKAPDSASPYWMGFWDGNLVFSNKCPTHYCGNSSLMTTGLTLEEINTSKQCDPDNSRHGLLCSQCATGTSSQLGSFKCTKCTFAGLLMVPFGAGIGVLIIIFLFLFNFTILQGDVIGIAFYTNVVCINYDFLLKYTPRFFYVLLTALNLGFGFETCFFPGMDEFLKAILQFVFPFYLIALLIAIIIAAHKFNLKIFHVRFVARRSVPVLATIMLLTYSGLINAVIYGLQYTTIYYAEDHGKYQIVWLHQPELEYFKGKHIAVGILCLLVVLFYLLPLTIITLFGDLLRICSRSLWFSHFLDVFHGAFRYPFGFWFGTRLLLRIIFSLLNIATSTPMFAYIAFLTTGCVILLQFFLEPFRRDNVTIYRPDPECKVTKKDLIKARLSRIFRPKVMDSLYLFNIMFMSMAIALSNDIKSVYIIGLVCLSIIMALLQLMAITVHHAYHHFPLPNSAHRRLEALRERFINFKQRLRERRTRRNHADPQDNAPVRITYLSASMCFNSDARTNSREDDSVYNEDTEEILTSAEMHMTGN